MKFRAWGRLILCILGNALVLFVYAIAMGPAPDMGFPIFLSLGMGVCLYRVLKLYLEAGIGGFGTFPIAPPMIRSLIDLATLFVVHQGVNQAKIETGRGSWMGAALGLLVVTPLLCFLIRSILKVLAQRIFPNQ